MTITDALSGLLNRYVEMVNSGDCGFWNPEKDAEVIAARAALAAIQTMGGKMTDAQVEAAAKAIYEFTFPGEWPSAGDLVQKQYCKVARAALAAAQAGATRVPMDEVVKMTDNVSRVGQQQGFAAGIEAAAEVAAKYESPRMSMLVSDIRALRPTAPAESEPSKFVLVPEPAGPLSEEDVERMICEWWGRTGRGILETSAINDLTRAVLALLRRGQQ